MCTAQIRSWCNGYAEKEMDVKEELEQWIVEELSVPDPDLNNIWPCPYAKKAWFENQVK